MKPESKKVKSCPLPFLIVFFIICLSIFNSAESFGAWPNLRDRDVVRQRELRKRISEIRRERPRIFMTNDEIEAARIRIGENHEVGEVYQLLKQWANGSQYYSNLWVDNKKLQGLVVAYRLEGKPQKIFNECIRCMDYLCNARPDSWTYPRAVRGLSMAYDWLYDDLTDAQKQKYGNKIIEYAKACYDTWKHTDLNNHSYLEYGPILYAGIALLDEGIDDEATEQLLLDGMQLLLDQFIPAHEQLARDGGWYESMSYHSFFTLEYAHLLELWQQASGEQVWNGPGGLQGDAHWLVYNARPWDDSRVHVADLDSKNSYDLANAWYLPLLWKHHKDGVARYWTDYIRKHTQNPVNSGYMWWPYVIWADADVPETLPEDLPFSRHFSGTGWVSTRGSWTQDASFGLFICSDWWGGHQHCDNNSFTIHKKAPLIIDSGIYDTELHRGNYSARSIAHNTITVYDPNEKFFGGTWGQSNDVPTENDGGQLYTPSPSGVKAVTPGSLYDRGDIISYRYSPLYTYTVGDATKSYKSSKLKEFKRAFIHFRPDLFVVFDRVESTDASFNKRWLLHAVNEPAIENNKVTIVNGTGNVTCQTIYPDKTEVVSTGGPGREFEVNRTNYASSKKDTEAGAWRVEISPEASRNRDYFLHVLRTAENNPVAPVVELLENTDSIGVRIQDNGHVYEVKFTTSDDLKCSILITDISGKTVAKDLLADMLPKILQHPKNQTVLPGNSARFYIRDIHAEHYRWQVNAGQGFVNIQDDEVFSGALTDTLSVNNTTPGISKYKFRCLLYSTSEPVFSNEAVLTVEEKEMPQIISVHPDKILPAGNDCQAILPDYKADVVATDNYTINPVITQTPDAGTPVSGSLNTVTLTATDESGNGASVSFNVKVADNTLPSVVCADNQNLTLSQEETMYLVKGIELDPASVTDNCGVLEISNNYNHSPTLESALFPEGSTTVTWLVTDAEGNQAQCLQDVNVSHSLGIETLVQHGITVYPNPTAGKVYYKTSGPLIRQIHVSDNSGNICFEQKTPGQEGILDFSQFTDGVYHLSITTKNDFFVFKIVRAG